MMRIIGVYIITVFTFNISCLAQAYRETGSNHGRKFEQLSYLLPSPNEYRLASGAPGPKYWQQKADYKIEARLDEKTLTLHGKETITYYNFSPTELTYLWLQLDENEHNPNSDNNYFDESRMRSNMYEAELNRLEPQRFLKGLGCNITKVSDASGKNMRYTINQTMMRIDLAAPLKPGTKISFNVEWHYRLPDRMTVGGRGGYEYFPEDGNYIFTITQWYPRLCVYSDFKGWQNQQFTGRGEFALTFGDFDVKMTVPADHMVCSTGELRNAPQVLTSTQLKRWQQAQNAKEPVEIVTLEEAKKAEQSKTNNTKTWHFTANNVRDFAWGSSRKFIWDAMAVDIEGRKVMAMSYYPKEAYGLYRRYSTKVVAHTLRVYSKYSIPYPYPVAISVEASNGMEYPMICFNYGRTEKDGTYSEAIKNGMISVIIHEVGHNFFPMIVNSDERQWSWMDEGLNTFLQYLAEQEFDNNFPSSRGPAHKIVDYMRLPKEQLEPIMTNSENIVLFGPNAYGKPATALNILRETIMGRDLFDFAFKEYSRRWAFKHPEPADFFRTMEDASGVDLDWFWRGWFFSVDAVDISLDTVKYFKLDAPENSNLFTKAPFKHIGQERNANDKRLVFAVDADTSLRDFYYYYNLQADNEKTTANNSNNTASDSISKYWAAKHFYELSFTNVGGLVSPIIIEWTFKDGSKQVDRIPAQIWRKNEEKVKKIFVKDQEVVAIRLDPYKETADINEENGIWPIKEIPSKFQLFKGGGRNRNPSAPANPMQRARQANEQKKPQ